MFEFKEIRCPRCKSLVPIGYIICPYCGYDLRPILRLRARQELTFKDSIRRLRMSVPFMNGYLIPQDLFNELMLAPDAIGPMMLIGAFSFFISLIYLRLILGLGIIGGLSIPGLFFILLIVSTLMVSTIFAIYIVVVNWLYRLIGATNAEFSISLGIIGYSLWPLVGTSIIALFLMIIYNPAVLLHGVEAGLSNPLITVSRFLIMIGLIVSLLIANEGLSKAYYVNRIISLIILVTPAVLLFLTL